MGELAAAVIVERIGIAHYRAVHGIAGDISEGRVDAVGLTRDQVQRPRCRWPETVGGGVSIE